MAIAREEIPCNFVGQFKVGDNLVFNAGLLCSLVESNKDGAINKLVVVQTARDRRMLYLIGSPPLQRGKSVDDNRRLIFQVHVSGMAHNRRTSFL